MSTAISSLVPTANDLLALEVEEVGGVLLVHLTSCGDNSGNGVVSRGLITPYNLFTWLAQNPPYQDRRDEVRRALMEGWDWVVAFEKEKTAPVRTGEAV